MNFPKNLESLINENTSDNLGKRDGRLLEIFMLNGDTNEIDKNLKSWFVTEVSSTKIDIKLTFEKPILVSTGYLPDMILV